MNTSGGLRKVFPFAGRQFRVEEQYGRQSNIIDYTYTNYDLAAVEADYEKAVDELSRAQLALDAVNQREIIPVEL